MIIQLLVFILSLAVIAGMVGMEVFCRVMNHERSEQCAGVVMVAGVALSLVVIIRQIFIWVF